MIGRLTDPWFEATFYGRCTDSGGHNEIDSMDGAQGLSLWCPCGAGKTEYPIDGGRPHKILVPFANPRNAPPCPPNHGPVASDGHHYRWQMTGTGLEDLTLAPSIAVGPPACWHGFIQGGEVK